jgi:hypothetical protein
LIPGIDLSRQIVWGKLQELDHQRGSEPSDTMSLRGGKLKLEIPEVRKVEGPEKILTVGSRTRVNRSEDQEEGKGQSVEKPKSRRVKSHEPSIGMGTLVNISRALGRL